MEEKKILKKLDEINTRLNKSGVPLRKFIALADESKQLINQLKNLKEEKHHG